MTGLWQCKTSRQFGTWRQRTCSFLCVSQRASARARAHASASATLRFLLLSQVCLKVQLILSEFRELCELSILMILYLLTALLKSQEEEMATWLRPSQASPPLPAKRAGNSLGGRRIKRKIKINNWRTVRMHFVPTNIHKHNG